MKRPALRSWLCAVLAFPAAAASAQEEAQPALSATVTLASEYTWRSISFSRRDPSLQTSVDYIRPAGKGLNLEAGAWLYSSKYEERPQISFDTGGYVGLNGPLADGWQWALRTMQSRYPQAKDWTYVEHSVHLSREADEARGSLGVELAYAYSPHAFGSGSRGRYLEAGLSMQLPAGLTLSLHAGRSLFSRPEQTYRNFNDWKLALAGQWQGFDIEAGWIVASHAAQFGRMGRPRAVLAVGRTF
ncbi:TorF family putative porin [Pseudoduganella rhizocola]|uniref:TorF family putative porin n=1 Tax=Pseudoduganella rhizocola TaxID=3382643 RepID=UPI0038B4F2E2